MSLLGGSVYKRRAAPRALFWWWIRIDSNCNGFRSIMARLTEAQRLRIVHLDLEGFSVKQIASRVGCSTKTTRFWLHQHQTRGDVKSLKPAGRRHLLQPPAAKRALQLLLEGQNGGARYVARVLLSEGLSDVLVSPGTVLRAAKAKAREDGDDLICKRGRPPKLLTPLTRTKRLEFSTANKSRVWRRVMFTDRCKFNFRYPGCKVRTCRWLKKSQQHEDGAFKPNRASVYNVYGGVTRYGTTRLHPVTGTTGSTTQYRNLKGHVARNITRQEYRDVLHKTLLPEGRRIFGGQGITCWTLQQDGDPTHSAAAKELEAHNRKNTGGVVALLPEWPGNSPDLSPIENVWAYVDSEVAKMGCSTFEEFKAAIDMTFRSIPRQMCANLFASMEKRLSICIERQGGKTGY